MPTLNGKYPIIIVQGAQWGSEGKGMVAAALCEERNIQWAVRTGAVNAGHTVYWGNTPHKMQQLPTGWINKGTKLVLGAGAYINPHILAAEIERINSVQPEGWPDVRSRLYIDFRAGLHLDSRHAKASQDANRHHLIGATGKGCSEAIVDKISNRNRGAMLFKQWLEDSDRSGFAPFPRTLYGGPLDNLQFCDTEQLLNEAYDRGDQILLEGTQGTFLDLHLGPYPYTTHKQCTAGQWAVECGLSPSLDYEVVLVARTYPIRVAGNSGPMPHEVDWPMVARRINKMRVRDGKVEWVSEWAIRDFENARRDVAQTELRAGRMTFPMTLSNDIDLQMHKWSDAERMEHRVALSELDKMALQQLSGPTVAQLTQLFEMTTVTRKLRRISEWSWDMMGKSIRQNRPSYIVLAFANYWFPELWGEERYPTEHKALDSIVRQIEETWNIDVGYITVGPKSQHMLTRPIGMAAVGTGTGASK